MAVDTTARGLLMLSPRLRLAMAATGVAAMDTTARGLLMLSLRLMLLLRLAMAMGVMEATAVDTDTDTARGLLSPAMATGATAMVVTVVVMAAMAAGTTVSYHQIRRSELSQKQNH